ncbi:MAG: molybdenum cofactor biosynthesis protein MoaE [bacterium]
MIVKVKLFAMLKESLGEEVELQVPEPATVSSLMRRFVEEYPQFREAAPSLNVAVDYTYSPGDQPIAEGQEVAIIPPVSGGASALHEIVEAPIDLNTLVAKVASPGAGGIATFLGVVRDNSLGRKVLYLFYEVYPPMAVKEMARVEAAVRERWEVDSIAITHRIGRLEIGEASVAIAVSSPHRKEAIEACHFAIDRLKQTVPVWKKEYWEGGEVWIENAEGSTIIQSTP